MKTVCSSNFFIHDLTLFFYYQMLDGGMGVWLYLPMESPAVIPERTCVRVTLTSPDPVKPLVVATPAPVIKKKGIG